MSISTGVKTQLVHRPSHTNRDVYHYISIKKPLASAEVALQPAQACATPQVNLKGTWLSIPPIPFPNSPQGPE